MAQVQLKYLKSINGVVNNNKKLRIFSKYTPKIISLTKSNNHPTNKKRTFFSNALRGIRIKEGT